MRIYQKIITVFLLLMICVGQDRGNIFGWKVEDTKMAEEFLQNYIDADKAVNGRPTFSRDVQVDNTLVVQFNRELNQIHNVYVYDEEGIITELDVDFVKEHTPAVLMDKIKARKYAWDDENPDMILSSSSGPRIRRDVVSIFSQINYKTNRDIFWWSYRNFDLSSSLRWSIRPQGSKWGFYMERGLSEAGYPGPFYRSLNPGLSNEVFKIYATLPVFQFLNLFSKNDMTGTVGLGLKYDSYFFGGFFQYSDISWSDLSWLNFPDPNRVVYPKVLAGIYYTTTFATNWLKYKFTANSSTRLKAILIFNQLSYGYKGLGGEDSTKSVYHEYNTSSLMQSFDLAIRLEWVSRLDPNTLSNKFRAMTQLQGNLTGVFKFQLYTAYELSPQVRMGIWAGYLTDVNYSRASDPATDTDHIWSPGFTVYPEISIIW